MTTRYPDPPDFGWNHSDVLCGAGMAPTVRVKVWSGWSPEPLARAIRDEAARIGVTDTRRSRFSDRSRSPYVHAPVLIVQDLGACVDGTGHHFSGPLDTTNINTVWASLARNRRRIFEFISEALDHPVLKHLSFSGGAHDTHGLPDSGPERLDRYDAVAKVLGLPLNSEDNWGGKGWDAHDAHYRGTFHSMYARKREDTIARGFADAMVRRYGVRTIGYNNISGVGGDYTSPNLYPTNFRNENPITMLADVFDRLMEAARNGTPYAWFDTPGIAALPKAQHEAWSRALCEATGLVKGRFVAWNHGHARVPRDDESMARSYEAARVVRGTRMDSAPPLHPIARRDVATFKRWLGSPERWAETFGCDVPEWAGGV